MLDVVSKADIVYIGLHGEDGENGKVQAVLDLNNIPYTGSGPLASGIAMDKGISKQVMMYNNIKTARFITVYKDNPKYDVPFDFPVVVKPSNGGSSIGTRIVQSQSEMADAVQDGFRFDSEVLVEEFVKGREFSLGVVNGTAMPAIEISVNDGWYDFQHKFQSDTAAKFQTPPDIPEEVHDEMKAIASRRSEC